MKTDFRIEKIGSRLICLKGVGKMFYQDGFPISLSVQVLAEKGIEVSMLHVADECLKTGWSPKTTVAKLRADFADDANKAALNLPLLEQFCAASYEEQREMIFEYLFGQSTDEARAWFGAKMSNQNGAS